MTVAAYRIITRALLLSSLLLAACARISPPANFEIQPDRNNTSRARIAVRPVLNHSYQGTKFIEVGVLRTDSFFDIKSRCDGKAPANDSLHSMLVTELSSQGLQVVRQNPDYILESTVVEENCLDIYASSGYALPIMLYAQRQTKSENMVKIVSQLIDPDTGRIVNSFINYGYSNPYSEKYLFLISFSSQNNYFSPITENYRSAINSVATSVARSFSK